MYVKNEFSVSYKQRIEGDPWWNLFQAIVYQAMSDYVQLERESKTPKRHYKFTHIETTDDIEEFLSDMFPNSNDQVINLLKEKVYGQK